MQVTKNPHMYFYNIQPSVCRFLLLLLTRLFLRLPQSPSTCPS